jgi:hypothetical protein
MNAFTKVVIVEGITPAAFSLRYELSYNAQHSLFNDQADRRTLGALPLLWVY